MSRPLLARLSIATAGLSLIVLLLVLLPQGIRQLAEDWLTEQGLEAQIEDIDLNLFTATAAIHRAAGKNSSGRGFQLEQLRLRWRYLPLLQKRLHLRQLDIQGLQLDVARESGQEQLEFAGITASSEPQGSGSRSDWGFGLDKIQIDATTVAYSDPLLRQSITLQASSVSDIASWAEALPIVISSEADAAGGELRLQGQIQPFGDHIKATLRLQTEGLPLATAAPAIPGDAARLDGLLHADLAIILSYAADSGLDLQVSGDSRLRHYQFGLAQPPLDIGGDLTHWQGGIKLLLPPDGQPQLSGNGKLAASEMRVTHRAHLTDLVYASSIDIPGIEISSLEAFAANSMQLGAGHALIDGEPATPLLSWKGIETQTIQFQNGGLDIAGIMFNSLAAGLSRNADGQWNLQQALARSLPPSAAETDTASEPAPLRIGSIELSEDSRLTIHDATVEPAFSLALHDVQAQLGNLDNQQVAQPSPVSIQAAVGDYGKLDLNGQIRPFATPPDADLQGKISGIDTVPLSGFARQLVGHRIRQGTVSGDLNIKVEQGKLNSSLDLVLNKLQIAAVRGEAGEFEKSSGMPLSTALSLLRDRDENIRLKLPIKGELDKPDIKINDIIRKAVFKAVQTAALTFYSPLGVITVGDKLLQLATALRFDPVPFPPGQASLTPQATTHLATLTDALIQRPALQITLCGIAVQADREVLAEQIATSNTRLFGLIRPEADPASVPEEQLLALAKARMRAVGDYMHGHSIVAERLILCEGEISETEKTKPGVRIEL